MIEDVYNGSIRTDRMHLGVLSAKLVCWLH